MKVKKLEWDTNFFGFPVGDVSIEDESPNSRVLNSEDFIFFQVRSYYPVDIISETHSLSYSEVKTVFSKQLLKKSEINDNIKDFDTTQIEESMFLDLAYESGKYGRYSQD